MLVLLQRCQPLIGSVWELFLAPRSGLSRLDHASRAGWPLLEVEHGGPHVWLQVPRWGLRLRRRCSQEVRRVVAGRHQDPSCGETLSSSHHILDGRFARHDPQVSRKTLRFPQSAQPLSGQKPSNETLRNEVGTTTKNYLFYRRNKSRARRGLREVFPTTFVCERKRAPICHSGRVISLHFGVGVRCD